MKIFAMAGFLLALGSAATHAQEWQIRNSAGQTFKNVRLERLSNDTLYFRHSTSFLDRVESDSIATITRFNRGTLLPATLVGLVGGGVVGYAVKPIAQGQTSADIYGAIFGAVVGGVAGFVVGNALEPDDVYDVRSLSRAERREILRSLLH